MTQVIEPSYHMYFSIIFSHIIGLYWPSKQGRIPDLDSYVHQLSEILNVPNQGRDKSRKFLLVNMQMTADNCRRLATCMKPRLAPTLPRCLPTLSVLLSFIPTRDRKGKLFYILPGTLHFADQEPFTRVLS